MTGFAVQLKAARFAHGLTQREVAAIVGRDTNTIARWERGELIPEMLVQEAALARLQHYPALKITRGNT